MVETKKESFPSMPTNHWWALRKKFQQSIPANVTGNYIASVLNMQANSAKANILLPLKMVGIIDTEGKTLDRAIKWRDDAQYPEVCDQIRKELYPQELLDVVPDASVDRSVVERWFANHTGLGERSAQKMAAFYLLLTEADPNKSLELAPTIAKKQRNENGKEKGQNIKKIEIKKPGKPLLHEATASPTTVVPKEIESIPSVNINIQIHISAEATPDQIDQIFASMAKHVYKRGSN